MRSHKAVIAIWLLSFVCTLNTHAKVKPIRALLVTGGCCHDYAHQKTILTEGISARANVVWSIVHEGDGTTDHRVSIYEDPDWAKNYDVIVHDECFADVKDAAFVRNILKPHREGLPAVNLHCAMHCYRVDFDHFKEWFEFTGLDTRAHGAQLPIELSYTATNHPITKGLTNWTTVAEELYNNLEIWKTVTPLIYGQQGNDKYLAAWVNNYRGHKVFSTTLGHNNATVADPRYLDLVTRGLLWSVNKLNADYLKPAEKKRQARKMVRVPKNIAFLKKASASASQDGHPPEHAADNESDTRWCAPDNGNNYWWQVDLEKTEQITGIRINWEHESAKYEYRVSISPDAQNWTTVVEQKGAPRPQMDEQKFSSEGRYVRVTITKAPEGSWASFSEVEVLGKELVERPASEVSDSRLAGVQSPAGFEQTLFAGPPNISYPTCLEATPTGDVFVGVDQNGSLDREKNRGWVVRCRDTNGDGVADAFTTFAKMDSPRGLVWDHNTLFVMHPPVLEAFYDDNNDGVADRSEVLVRGLANDLDFRGADHTCNGLRMGIDGWLYIALGDYGAMNAVAKDGSHIQLHGGGIVRVRPDGTRLETVVEGTRNIYDVAIDPFMNIFTCDNTNDGDDWNLRLSHMIPTAHYGYPSLFKNFPDEIMPTMRDFGGGSPTGAFFVDEPGFSDFGGLLTCQWGWNNVSRHPLKRSGATFRADKETFVRIPRPTGIAADGLGNLYIASWKGATFNFAGPDVGFVVRVTPLDHAAAKFPHLEDQSDRALVSSLQSPSAVQRLHVQREILRRRNRDYFVGALTKIADSKASLSVRAAAIFTLGQIDSPRVGKSLLQLCRNATIREFALRAYADSTYPTPEIFVQALADTDVRVRLQAIMALSRLNDTQAAEKLFSLACSPDIAEAHTAFRALVHLRAVDVCLKALDSTDITANAAALRVLGNIHETRVVDGLIQHLRSTDNAKILETLCRLYFREADWDGSWWTTRPDTTGPYYKVAEWDGTPRIKAVLHKELAAGTDRRSLLLLLQKYKISFPEITAADFAMIARDSTIEPSARKKAFQSLTKLSETAAFDLLAASDADDKPAAEIKKAFIEDGERAKHTETYFKILQSGDEKHRIFAETILRHIGKDNNAPTAARQLAANAVNDSNAKPTPAAHPKNEGVIAKLPYEQVLSRATAFTGDAESGAKLFETLGCAKCHTVLKTESPKGPFLGDITARYSKAEILESILRPSAKIAQGFETTTIETKDGESIDGFIVRESGDEIELRNLAGVLVVPKNKIASRGTRKTSIMPDGLADNAAPEDLASVIRYLESTRAKN